MSVFKTLLGWMTAGPDRITASEGQARVAAGAMLVDVRSPGEFASGHLWGAVNIPVEVLATRLGELVADKTQDVVVYCSSGARSARAAALLRRAGWTSVGDVGPLPDRWAP